MKMISVKLMGVTQCIAILLYTCLILYNHILQVRDPDIEDLGDYS